MQYNFRLFISKTVTSTYIGLLRIIICYLKPYNYSIIINEKQCHLFNSNNVHQRSGMPGFNPRSSHTKNSKNDASYLLA